jgi:YVTN family beta-propeller protein
METAKVFEIDVAKRKVLRKFKTESAWTKVVALSPDEKTLYAANWSGNDVSIISLKSGKLVRRVAVAKTPRGLWPTQDGKWLYVASFDRGVLEKINLDTYAVKTVFRGGGAMRHLVADEKRGMLFTSDMAKDCVWVTDMKTGKTRRFARVGHKPNTIALSPDGRVLFVSNRGANNAVSYYLIGPEWGSIMLLDAHTGRPLDGVVGGNQCTALAISADGALLVFSDFLDNRLRVYEVPEYAKLAAGRGGRAANLARDVKK